MDATVDDGAIAGTTRITLRNDTAAPLHSVRLFLYPEHYAERPDLDDLLFERVYPRLWQPGRLELGEVLVDGSPAAVTEPDGPIPQAEVVLATPLAPGASTQLEVPFTTRVPWKYGTFGRARGTLTATGAWHPTPVALSPDGAWLSTAHPPAASWDVTVRAPSDRLVVVGDGVVLAEDEDPRFDFVPPAAWIGTLESVERGDEQLTARWRSESARWVALSVRERGVRTDIPLGNGTTLTFVGRKLTRPQRRWLRRAADAGHEVLSELEVPPTGHGLLVVEAPMRRQLVELGDGVLFVSDRYLEVESLFWRYHDVHFARGLLALAIEDAAIANTDPALAPFVLDGLSWQLVGDYVAARWKNHVALRSLLQRFSFFPQVQSLLETPAFPFADQIFDNPWIVDPLGADVRRFNRPLRSGRTLFLRVAERAGSASLRAATLRVLRGDVQESVLDHLAASTGLDLDDLATSWLGPVPRVDYRLESVARRRNDEGKHVTDIAVRRVPLEGEPVAELVEVRLRKDPGIRRGQVTLRWRGAEELQTWSVVTDKRMNVVEIDPVGRVIELDEHGLNLRQDNRRPMALRVSGFGYAGLSITGQGFDAYGLLNLREKYTSRNHVNLRAFSNQQAFAGGGVTYAHYFGPPRWGLSLRHRVVATLDVQWLNTNFRPTDAPLLVELTGGYVYESRSDSFMPTRGGRFEVVVNLGKDFALEKDGLRSLAESGFVGIDVDVRRLFKLHSHHVLAVRGKAGVILGNVVHSLFPLGGNDDLRGMPENLVLTPARVLGVAEWRHMFFKDADIPLPFQRVRGLQGALFLEGAFAASELGATPSVGDLYWSVGYGFRWFVDWLGVLPGAWGMDFGFSPGVPPGQLPVGWPPDEWPEVPFQVYFVGSQSF